MHTFTEKIGVVKCSKAPLKRDFPVILYRAGTKHDDGDCDTFIGKIDTQSPRDALAHEGTEVKRLRRCAIGAEKAALGR